MSDEIKFRHGLKKITIDNDWPAYSNNGQLTKEGEAYVKLLLSNYEKALDAIADEYLDTYNDAWVDPEGGYRAMTRKKFKKCFKFHSITISDEELSGSLVFVDNGVMGQHWFDVSHDEEMDEWSAYMMG